MLKKQLYLKNNYIIIYACLSLHKSMGQYDLLPLQDIFYDDRVLN